MNGVGGGTISKLPYDKAFTGLLCTSMDVSNVSLVWLGRADELVLWWGRL